MTDPMGPPPERLVSALVTAGISRSTALAMEPDKAEEVLLLLGTWGVRTVTLSRRAEAGLPVSSWPGGVGRSQGR